MVDQTTMQPENVDHPGMVKIEITYECHCGATTAVSVVGDPVQLKHGILPTIPLDPAQWERTSHVPCTISWEIQFANSEEGECSSTKES
jgi:hypothetical protein